MWLIIDLMFVKLVLVVVLGFVSMYFVLKMLSFLFFIVFMLKLLIVMIMKWLRLSLRLKCFLF